MNEQIKKDRELLDQLGKDGWMTEIHERWGLEGGGYRWNPDNIPQQYQIKDLIIKVLEAQARVTQYEERTRAAEIVELLQVRIADQEPYIQLDTSTRMVVQSELDGIRDSVLYPPTL